MGYSTDFTGVLKFKKELTGSQLAYLEKFLGEDRRDCDWGKDLEVQWYHTDLEIADDYSGIQWNGTEKTYGLTEIVNFISDKMNAKFGDFVLIGELIAQGEEHDDRWKLVMDQGVAKQVQIPVYGDAVECPHCGGKFTIE